MKTKSRSSLGTHSYIARHSLDLQPTPVQQRNLQINGLNSQTNPAQQNLVQQESVQQRNLQINALDLHTNPVQQKSVQQESVELQMASIINSLNDILLTDTANQMRKNIVTK